jgi:hypothetical protein
MKSLFTKLIIISFCFLFSGGIAFAQGVKYTIENEDKIIGLVTFNYKKDGSYETAFDKLKISFDIKPHGVVETIDDAVTTIFLSEGDKYYHDYYDLWRTTLVTTSKGEKGFAMVFFEGPTKEGRSYFAEIWVGDKIVSKSRTVIDERDHIVSKTAVSELGLIHLKRQ